MSECCGGDANNERQRKILWIALVLNGLLFFIEFAAGWLADSSGLLADSLDMLADALVYGVSLYAVGRSMQLKTRAALLNGGLQLTLGLMVLLDIVKRIWLGSDPQPVMMTWVALLALAVNLTCFVMMYQFRQGDINLRASWICSRNDMLANIGVIVAAALVSHLQAPWPDWVIGGLIAMLVILSSIQIIRSANNPEQSHEHQH